MSTYTNYESTAATDYDSTRVPGGVEIFEALLRKYSPDALSDTTILDLGCGTGSYPKELLSAGIKHAYLIDGSQKMVEIAQQKMTKANFANFNTKHVILPDLSSVPNLGSYSAVTSMMVLHHLPKSTPAGIDLSPVADTIANGAKATKDKGVFVLGFQTPKQIQSHWFSTIVPENCAKVSAKCPELSFIRECFVANGMEVRAIYNILMPLTGATYYDGNALVETESAWAQDSVMSGATPSELAKAKAFVTSLKADGKLDQYVRDNDKAAVYGYGTIIAATRK